MRTAILAATALSLIATSLIATGALADALSERQAIMKERGALLRVLGPIAQGKQPFDAGTVMDALEKLHDNAARTDVPVLWAPGTDGGDTESLPKIWEDMEAYQAANDKYEADTQAALAANPQDLATFQQVFGSVASNCGSCHEAYRM